MRKVIAGKVYDTSKAELVAEWQNHYFPGDFHYCSEDLYRTPKGQWFVHGEGGAMSKYHRPAGNNAQTGGSDITPMSDEEAQAWLEDHDFVAELEEYFTDKIEEA